LGLDWNDYNKHYCVQQITSYLVPALQVGIFKFVKNYYAKEYNYWQKTTILDKLASEKNGERKA